MGTFSKAFGVVGGHVSGSEDLVRFALNKSRTWLLSGSHPPAVAAACTAAIDVLENEPEHVERLWALTRRFRETMRSRGFDLGASTTPIVPVMIGDSARAKQMSRRLFELGVFALPIVFPMVARDRARIRTILNAAISDEQLGVAIDAFTTAGHDVGLV
jgi:glycine C-acetyltransferase